VTHEGTRGVMWVRLWYPTGMGSPRSERRAGGGRKGGDPVDEERNERLTRFASALRAAMQDAEETQTSLGDAIGVSQGAVSLWLRGGTDPEPALVFAAERAMGLRAGQLSGFLGYRPVDPVDAPPSVAVAIEADPSLSESDRTILRTVLRALGDRSG
jgi:transcriptional regulator with XRE-family HTH domain